MMKTFNEFVSLSERPLTKGEEDKKEDIVKGMKKDKKGFENRYGDDAESVMYATATKLAKEDVTLQDADGNDFLEVVDLIKPDPIKGVATEQKELEPKKNPEPTVDQEPSKDKGNAEIKKNDKGNAEIKKKEKKVNMMKRMILMKKMQAVRAGAGMDIVAHHEPEEEMVEGARRPSELKSRAKLEALLKRKEDLKKKQKVAEGIVDMVKKGAKRHAKAIEKKKIKNRKAVPYAALGASYEPEGEVIDERLGGKGYQPYTNLRGERISGDWENSDRGGGHKWKERVGKPVKKKSPTYLAHVHNKGKKKIDPEKNPVVDEGVVTEADPRLAIYQSGMTDASRVKGPVGKAVDKVKDKVKKVFRKKDKVSSHLDRYRFQSGLDNYLKSKVKKEEVELDEGKKKGLDGKVCWKGYKLVGTKKKGDKTVDDCVKVDEAKVDKGRSDYGKATIRNWRHSGPDTVEPAMFDPENKRGKTIELRRKEHLKRRNVKTKGVKEEVIDEEGYDKMRDDRLVKYGIGHDGSDRKGSVRYHSRPDTPEQKKRKQAASDQAYKSVVDKLRKRYPGGVMTSSRKFRDGKEVK